MDLTGDPLPAPAPDSPRPARRRPKGFKALVDNAPDVISRFDRNLRYLYINPAMERDRGISPRNLTGRTNGEAGIPAERIGAWHDQLKAVFAAGAEREFEYTWDRGSAGRRYFLTRMVPEFAPDGTVESVLTISR